MADAGYQANEGSPEQLPRGEAAALNENTNIQAPEDIDINAPVDAPGGEGAPVEEAPLDPEDLAQLEDADAADLDPLYEPASEDEAWIVGPTTRPDEPETAGTAPVSPISPRLRQQLPVLLRASEEPGASPELQQLVDFILRYA